MDAARAAPVAVGDQSALFLGVSGFLDWLVLGHAVVAPVSAVVTGQSVAE